MITLTQLKEYAERKNLKFDTFTHICHNRYYRNPLQDKVEYMIDLDGAHKGFSTTYFGLQTSFGIWYWFKRSTKSNNNGLSFYERYSQRTGQTVKGFRTGFNLTYKIKNYLNK